MLLKKALGYAPNLYNFTILRAIKNIKTDQSSLGIALDNSRLTVSGYAAYKHVGNKARRFESADHTQLKLHIGTLNGLYKIQLPNSGWVVHSRHVTVRQ